MALGLGLGLGLSKVPAAADGAVPIEDIVGLNLNMDMSAKAAAAGIWTNEVLSPNDGVTADYDVFFGTTSGADASDPTFTAGSPPYQLFDGGDTFLLDQASNPTVLENMHKTTGASPMWFACAFQTPSSIVTLAHFISTNTGNIRGVEWTILSGGQMRFGVRNGPSFSNMGSPIATSTDHFVVIRFNMSSTGSEGFAINAETFTGVTITPGVDTSTPGKFTVGSKPPGTSQFLDNGFRMYRLSSGAAIMTDAQLAQLKATYEADLGITF